MKPYYETEDCKLFHGDCIEVMRTLDDNSVDAIVTDPPSGIAFMGKEWDKDKGGRDSWIEWMSVVAKEALRTVKPGAHALVWALPRTSHWTATAWENAGWEVRDCVYHVFSSGFPKSLNISKQIDKMAGAEREIVGYNRQGAKRIFDGGKIRPTTLPITLPATQWHGWGSALKPAVECWWLLRAPLDGTIAENVLKHGCGGINIDKSRIPTNETISNHSRGSESAKSKGKYGDSKAQKTHQTDGQKLGRYPVNLILDDSAEVKALFPESAGQQGDIKGNEPSKPMGGGACFSPMGRKPFEKRKEADTSGARFFKQIKGDRIKYTSKASQSERHHGMRKGDNKHPTVKPLELIEYLIKLILPPNGTVLDMFFGSGTLGVVCKKNGWKFIGIEQDKNFCDIAVNRIGAQPRIKSLPGMSI